MAKGRGTRRTDETAIKEAVARARCLEEWGMRFTYVGQNQKGKGKGGAKGKGPSWSVEDRARLSQGWYCTPCDRMVWADLPSCGICGRCRPPVNPMADMLAMQRNTARGTHGKGAAGAGSGGAGDGKATKGAARAWLGGAADESGKAAEDPIEQVLPPGEEAKQQRAKDLVWLVAHTRKALKEVPADGGGAVVQAERERLQKQLDAALKEQKAGRGLTERMTSMKAREANAAAKRELWRQRLKSAQEELEAAQKQGAELAREEQELKEEK